MKWLRAHARYDDSHPWEALEIVATLLGADPGSRDIEGVHAAIQRSYDYMRILLDDCMAASGDRPKGTVLTHDQAA
jgi:pyrroloquinoline quinone (PQQ) biosynthesis protein C